MKIIVLNLKALKRYLKEIPEKVRCISALIFRRIERHNELGDVERFESATFNSKIGDVKVVTPRSGHYMTTFFDVTPLSPDKKRLCVTKVPFINRIPIKGDVAEICIVELDTNESKTVYLTRGWGSQLGANVQWVDNENIICNDLIDGKGRAVKVNINSFEVQYLDGPIYGTAPDKLFSYSGDIELINALIPGYGVPANIFFGKRQKTKVSSNEGVWKTNIATGTSELFLSIKKMVDALPKKYKFEGGTHYVFNVKVSPDNEKLFVILVTKKIPFRAGAVIQLITYNFSNGDINLIVPDSLYSKGGHHPNWSPDSKKIIMNLKYSSKTMQFVEITSEKINVLASGVKGSGHPSLDSKQRYILTDSYTSEGFSDIKGYVPIRLVSVTDSQEFEVCRVNTKNITGPRRIDPHPVWIDENRFIFNGIVDGYRQVLLADLSEFLTNE
jgi:hypothetical protein